MSEKLKPCPFCGSENLELQFQRLSEDRHEKAICQIICHDCCVHAGFLFHSDEDAMIKKTTINAWNTRAYEPKSGTWKLESEFEGTKTWECPFCHEVYYFDDFTYKFCPACGAHLEMEQQS